MLFSFTAVRWRYLVQKYIFEMEIEMLGGFSFHLSLIYYTYSIIALHTPTTLAVTVWLLLFTVHFVLNDLQIHDSAKPYQVRSLLQLILCLTSFPPLASLALTQDLADLFCTFSPDIANSPNIHLLFCTWFFYGS